MTKLPTVHFSPLPSVVAEPTPPVPTAAPLSGRLATDNAGKPLTLSQKWRARPLNFGGKLLGLGSSRGQERASRIGLPPALLATEEKGAQLLRTAKALEERVDRILDTTLEQLPDVNHRPQRSRAMKILTSLPLLGSLKPKKIRDLLRKDPHYTAGKTRHADAASPADLREEKITLVAELGAKLDALKVRQRALSDVMEKLEAALDEHHAAHGKVQDAETVLNEAAIRYSDKDETSFLAAQAIADAPDTPAEQKSAAHRTLQDLQPLRQARRTAQEALDATQQALDAQPSLKGMQECHDARKALEEAVRDLHAVTTVDSMIGLGANALATDLVHQKIEFVKGQIAQCTASLRQASTAPITILLQQRDALAEGVQLAELQSTNAAITVLEMEVRMRDVQTAIAEAEGNTPVESSGPPVQEQLEALQRRRTQLNAPVADGTAAMRRLKEPREETSPSISELLPPPSNEARASQAPDPQDSDDLEPLDALKRLHASLASHLELAKQALAEADKELDERKTERNTFEAEFADKMRTLTTTKTTQYDSAIARLQVPGQAVEKKAEDWRARLDDTRELERRQYDLALAAMVETPPGFSSEQMALQGDRLKAQLRQIVDALPVDDPTAERMLPRVAIVEILCRSIAGVVKGDVVRAAALLDDVLSHPGEHWIALPPGEQPATDATTPTHAAPSAELRALFHKMAEVPRGLEILDQLSAQDGRQTMGRVQAQAFHAYWMADKYHGKASAADRQWLEAAMSVARREVRNRKDEPPAFPDRYAAACAQLKVAKDDLAQRREASPAQDEKAFRAAQAAIDAARAEMKKELDKLVAFRAVSKGVLSRAEFDRIDQPLRKLGEEWIRQAQDQRRKSLRWLPPSPLDPKKTNPPFHPRILQLANRQLEAQGKRSVKSVAHDSVAGLAQALSARFADGCMTKLPQHAKADKDAQHQARLFDSAGKILCRYIARQKQRHSAFDDAHTPMRATGFHRTKRLYKADLDWLDIEQLRREIMADVRANNGDRTDEQAGEQHRKLIKPTPNPPSLPEPFATMFAQPKLSATDALRQLVAHLDGHLDDQDRETLGIADLASRHPLGDMDKKIGIARRKGFATPGDVLEFFAPMLEELRLRDQLVLTGGGDRGGGLPLLPWMPMAPIVANLNFTLSRKQESSFQIKSPTYGVEFTISEGAGPSGDVRGNLGFGMDLGVIKAYLPAVTLKGDKGKLDNAFTVLRILREKNDDGIRMEQEARDDSLVLLDTLLRWNDGKHPVTGEQFSGPLEAILALHPNVQLGWGNKKQASQGLGSDLGVAARAGFAEGHMSIGPAVTPLSLKAEKVTEISNERNGYPHHGVHDRTDQRKQRVGGSASLGAIAGFFKIPVNQHTPDGEPDKSGAWRMMGPTSLDLSREYAYNLEKNGATRFTIGDKTGGSVDRAYGTPKDLLAEIEANREEVLMRFLDTVPVPKGAEKDTPQHRQMAETMLEQFIVDLKAAKGNPTWQYNVKYEMQPRMSGWVDALNALSALATTEGDTDGARKYHQASNRLLSFRSSWAFKNCAIRSKGKESADIGWDMFVRLLARRTAETSVSPAAYPG